MEHRRVKPALVSAVLPGSLACRSGVVAGDQLLAINGVRPRDLIDYRYLSAEERLDLSLLDNRGQTRTCIVHKQTDEELGIEFASALFDGLIQCNNACPFCFIDQQPDTTRPTLHLKDDDYRLSFLYGSYLTLTNLSPAEWERIEKLRLSPLFVSVHATEPDLRARMLKNPRAGRIIEQLQWFRDRRLQLHAQVVLCPGINDGEHLERTLLDLSRFHHPDFPTVLSAAVVPVGLTRFRPEADPLTAVTPGVARDVIRQVEALQRRFRRQLGTRFAWLSDEWYLLAGRPIPRRRHYEGYAQLGNGVGSLRQFTDELTRLTRRLPRQISPPRRVSWVVGTAVARCFTPIVERLNRTRGLEVMFKPLSSPFWGSEITVTGLLTGSDLIAGLAGQDLGDALVVPQLMLKEVEAEVETEVEVKEGEAKDLKKGWVFLDDLSIEALEGYLGVPVLVAVNGAAALVETFLGQPPRSRLN